MIELTIPGGARVALNPMLVFAVIDLGAHTRVLCAGGSESVTVAESYDEVQRKLAAWTRS